MSWLKNRGAFTPGLDAMTGTFYDTFGVCYGGLEPAESGGGTTVPDTVFVGCSPTFSMPTDHSGTAEYVSGQCFVPTNWDMTTDFRCIVWFAQAAAETLGEQFVWNLQHNFGGDGDTLGSYAEVSGTTTLTGEGTVQYTIWHTEMALPYHNALGTAERGGWLNFLLHRKILGTTGEGLLMGVQFGYWGTSYDGGVNSGTLQSKILPSLRAAH
jgi:hypothetical protein